MKTRLALFILLTFSNQGMNGQIEWLSPLPTGNTLTSAWFFDEQNGIIAGHCGDLLKTSNGGQSWERYVFDPYPEAGYHFNDICFTDDQTGYLAGSNIFKTTDGGGTWVNKIGGSYNDIFFLSPDSGWAAGNNGALVRTSNGGENWVSLTYFPLDQVNLQGIWFTDPQHGWAVGNGHILRTSTAGTGWDFISYNNNTFYDIFFIGSETGWICGNGGIILRTTNGGDNWQPVTVPGNPVLMDIYFSDPLNGWAVGAQGAVIHSTDGGLTWEPLPGAPERTIYSFSLAGPQKIYLTGEGGILLTSSDAGLTWESLQKGITGDLADVCFADEDYGWSVSFSGRIYRTTDGGQNWTMAYQESESCFVSVCCTDNQHVWAAGYYTDTRTSPGMILNSADGGQNWSLQAEEIMQVNQVTFTNNNKGWAVGNGGAIYHTGNGGNIWSQQSSGCVNDLYAVYFWDDENGLAGGYDEVVQTSNGGQTWVEQWVYQFNFWFIVAFYATDPVNRIAAGEQNMYFADTEGNMWHNMNQYVNGVSDMEYSSPQYRWLTGNDGLLLRQGGDAWKYYSVTNNDLHAIFIDRENGMGYVAGDYGTILSLGLDYLTVSDDPYMEGTGPFAKIFPNPACGNLTAEFKLKDPSSVNVQVFNLTGQQVRSVHQDFIISGKQEMNVNLDGIAPGIYFYRITDGDRMDSGKIIIQKL